MTRPVVIAGAASGVGKTTLAAGIMGACRCRGLKVAPFKVGPDYIDPGFHQRAAGAPSRNLDTWLTSADEVRAIYRRGAAAADVSIVEGVMGLFDGRAGAGAGGSTAEVSGLIGGAVMLVADCARQARSLAPLLKGFATFDAGTAVAGCILNNVGGAGHERILRDAAREAGVTVFGVLPRQPEIVLPSRHLGLVQAGGADAEQEKLELIIDHVQQNVDIDALLALAGNAGGKAASEDGKRLAGFAAANDEMRPPGGGAVRERPPGASARIAVARDEAFSFYYVDGLEALEEAGAELAYFSPLRDEALPACDGVYLGGGYPEVYAAELEANRSMRESVAAAVSGGLPTYAECGGLVYLCRELEEHGRSRRMAGVLSLTARMTGRRQALGYVEATARRDSILMPAGASVRGHEFHWSAIDWSVDDAAYDCYSGRLGRSTPDGYLAGGLLASYVHIHFGGNRDAAAAFVGVCARARGVSARVHG
ncbi:MAG: cobyrinate a,c-diamide synthase [Thermoleophilia bacterium]